MVEFRARHKKSGILLAALLLLGLMVPTIDTFLCGICDAVVTSQEKVTQTAEKKDAPAKPLHDDGDALCVHGHCHHWVGFTKPAERLPIIAMQSGQQSYGLYGTPPSAPQIELLRPPRA